MSMKTYQGWLARFFLLFMLLALLLFGIEHTAKSSSVQDRQRLLEAIKKAAVTCYSVEGFYPQDIEYLVKNYGILVDENRYQIHYEYSGRNLMPDIRIFEKGDGK